VSTTLKLKLVDNYIIHFIPSFVHSLYFSAHTTKYRHGIVLCTWFHFLKRIKALEQTFCHNISNAYCLSCFAVTTLSTLSEPKRACESSFRKSTINWHLVSYLKRNPSFHFLNVFSSYEIKS